LALAVGVEKLTKGVATVACLPLSVS